MRLSGGKHLAYCTNIHPGERWSEILSNLERHTLAVRRRVCPEAPYAIGLRLGAKAVEELQVPAHREAFARWLEQHRCYVFTINGFPYGTFHGTRVKEQVYAPDWTTEERLAYTCRLFELLVDWLPPGVSGSVSTLPGSFKGFIRGSAQVRAIQQQLWRCVDYLSNLSERSGRDLHLGLEPEPLCLLETTDEVIGFFEELAALRPGDERWRQHLGLNYDTCHLAVEFEAASEGLARLDQAGIRLSKLHLSSALKTPVTSEALERLAGFEDPVYFHQVVTREPSGRTRRYSDLPEALASAEAREATEWRVHYHVPLHAALEAPFQTTSDHLLAALDHLRAHPDRCDHLEMETYTWSVLPPALRERDVVDQLVQEYSWTLRVLAERGWEPIAAGPRFQR